MYRGKDFGLSVTGTSGGEELVLCPFHSDRKSSAWFSPRRGLFYCAVCGFGLNVYQLVKKLGLDIEVQDYEIAPEELEYNFLNEHCHLELGEEIYVDYFEQRGIDEQTIRHYGVRWLEGKQSAAVLPLTDLKGEVKGAAYRYTRVKDTRYRMRGETTPVWPFHHLVGLHDLETVLVTEGAWSAMKIFGYCQARGLVLPVVALLGAKANRKVVDALRPFEVVYLYDGDMAGSRACKRMRELSPTSLAFTLRTSPDDMTDSQIEEMLVRMTERMWKC